MDIVTKSAGALISDTSTESDTGPGTFEVILSDSKLDRDGDTLLPNEWELPLPESVTFVNDHDHRVNSIVGSAVPVLEGGRIVCRGTYATTSSAQDTRKLVKGKHLTHVSVAYREKRDRKSGNVSRELINGSFVVVPSNTNAKVLASKAFDEKGDLTEEVQTLIVKSVEGALKQMEDAGFFATMRVGGSILPEGFTAETTLDSEKSTQTLHIKDADGKLIASHEFPAPTTTAPSPEADPAADTENRAKALAMAQAQLLSFTSNDIELEGN